MGPSHKAPSGDIYHDIALIHKYYSLVMISLLFSRVLRTLL
jgi:hypothetical protein